METPVNPDRKRLVTIAAVALAIALVAGAAFLVRQVFFGPKTITAYFPSATAIYPGDEVRVSGVKVGTIDSIEPEGTQTKMTLEVDRDVPVPADAKAVIVAQNLVAARYVQLTPAYRSGDGPTMADGAVIPASAPPSRRVGRGQDPIDAPGNGSGTKERRQAVRTPRSAGSSTAPPTRWDGNGEKLRETLAQLSGVARIFADGSGNIVDIIKNLQIFVTALRDSKDQIVQFQNRLATLTSVLDDSRSDLDAALTNLSVAIGEVQRFVAGSRNQTAEQIQRLGNVTQILVDNQMAFENVLHVAPNAIANFYNIYYPNGGSVTGAFSLVNFSNPVQVDLRHDRRRREHHRARDRETVRAVPRPGAAAAELQRLPFRSTRTCGRRSTRTGSSTPTRSSRRAAPGRRIRRSRRRRCPPTPERATSRRRRDGTGRPNTGRASTRPAATKPARIPSPGGDQPRAADPRPTARHLEYSGRKGRPSRGCCSRRPRRRLRRDRPQIRMHPCCLQKGRRHHDPRNEEAGRRSVRASR